MPATYWNFPIPLPVWIIGVLFVLGLICQFILIGFYIRQVKWLRHAELRVEAGGKPNFNDLREQVEKDTPVRQVLDLLCKDASREEAAAVLSQLEFYEDRRTTNAISNTFVSLLLVFGLAGTLLAFRTTIGEAPPFLNSAGEVDTTSIDNFVKTLLPGFSNAFLSSIAGILGTTMLFMVRSVIVAPARMRLFSGLQHLVQQVAPAGHGASEAATKPSAALESASRKMAEVAGRMETLAESLNHSHQGANATAEVLARFADEFKQPMNVANAVAQRLGESSEALARMCAAESPLAATMGALANLMTNLYQAVERAAADRASQEGEILKGFAQLNETLAASVAFSQGVNKATEGSRAQIDALNAKVGELRMSMTALTGELSKLSSFDQKLGNVEKLTDDVRVFVAEAGRNHQNTTSRWDQALRSLDGVANDNRVCLERLLEQHQNGHSTITQGVANLQGVVDRHSTQLNATVIRALDSWSGATAALKEEMGDEHKATNSDMAKGVASLQQVIRAETSEITKTMGGTIQTLTSTMHELARTVSAFKNEVASMKETFVLFRAQMEKTPPIQINRWRFIISKWIRGWTRPSDEIS